jgi:hypothetical protein
MKIETTARLSRQCTWLATALLGLLLLQITSCTSVPEGSPAMKQQALSFTPPLGKAGIYVIRPNELAGSASLDEISFDFLECGSLATDTYLFGTVLPGEHTLRCYTPNESSGVVHFTAEAGKNYYFKVYHHDDGLVSLLSTSHHYTFVPEPVSETDGQAYVRKFKLSGDNRFEYQN